MWRAVERRRQASGGGRGAAAAGKRAAAGERRRQGGMSGSWLVGNPRPPVCSLQSTPAAQKLTARTAGGTAWSLAPQAARRWPWRPAQYNLEYCYSELGRHRRFCAPRQAGSEMRWPQAAIAPPAHCCVHPIICTSTGSRPRRSQPLLAEAHPFQPACAGPQAAPPARAATREWYLSARTAPGARTEPRPAAAHGPGPQRPCTACCGCPARPPGPSRRRGVNRPRRQGRAAARAA